MSLKESKFSIAFVVALAALLGFGMFVTTARANPSDFNRSNVTATTSVTALTSGSTIYTQTYDSFNGGNSNASDSGVLLLQTTASSTSSVFAVSVQYSMDNLDWYSDNLIATTSVTTLATPQSYTLTATATTTKLTAIDVPMPTRYARAVITASGANGTVWSTIVAKKQQPE